MLEYLRRGEYETIVTARQSALDALGVLTAASQMNVTRQREGIPDDLPAAERQLILEAYDS